MSEESTTPDLVERGQRLVDAINARDFDAVAGFYAPDAVYESVGMGATFEGVAAIRAYLEDLIEAFEGYTAQIEEGVDLGAGIGLAVINQQGRPLGSSSEVRMRYAALGVWVEGSIVRHTMYTDIAVGRAAAEQLAEERA
jgi:ketosteroid isomerase-like protein